MRGESPGNEFPGLKEAKSTFVDWMRKKVCFSLTKSSIAAFSL